MLDPVRFCPDNPHPLSQMRTELATDGKYDEYGNRRSVDFAGSAMPMQKVETVDMPMSEALASGQTTLGELQTTMHDDFQNRLIWGDNKLVMASLLKEFRGKIDLIYTMTSSSRPNSRRAALISSTSSREASKISTATVSFSPLRMANFDKILL